MNRAKRIALVGSLGLLALVFGYASFYAYGWYVALYLALGTGAGYGAYYFYGYGKAA